MKDKKIALAVISVSAIAAVLALTVTVTNPSQDLSSAFGEPNEFERELTKCLKIADNVGECLLSVTTISPSSGPAEDALPPTTTPSVDTSDQLSLLRYCLTEASGCSPSIDYVQRDVYQRPYEPLQINEVILELADTRVDMLALANEIVELYDLVVLDTVDTPNYKAIIIQAPNANNPVFSDTRFEDYNLPNNPGRGELNGVYGHITQLQWNQTIPYGLKRTIPIADTSNQSGLGINNTQAAVTAASNATTRTTPSTIAALDTLPARGTTSATVTNTTNATAKTADVDIAILDTGISLNHPDLNVYRGVSMVDNTTSSNDDLGHGSHVAGIAAAKDNSMGIVGVAPGARLWAIKVCDSSGECKVSNQIKGVEYAIKNAGEIDVLNISIENPVSPALNNILNAAVRAGITVVVSAGNYGKDASTTSPANNPNVITVSAIGDSDGKCGGTGPAIALSDGNVTDDTLAYFSNFGPVVKMAAPGVNVFSTYNGSGYAVDSGTSMAAPYVAGAAALYKSANPNASPAEVSANVTASGSLPTTVCDGGAHGYFAGDRDRINEPLLFREISSD